MTFPLSHTVDHYPWSAGATDELGNTVDSWAETPTAVKVFGYSIGIAEKLGAHATAEVLDATVSAPATWAPTVRDRVSLGTSMYEVVSLRLQDTGFHTWEPGVTVLLKKLEG